MTFDLGELEHLAAQSLATEVFDYTAGGGNDETTVSANVAAWQELRLSPHVLRDVSQVSTATTVLGTSVSAPVLVSPTAMHRLFDDQAELATTRATADFGTTYIVSHSATTAIEDITAERPDAVRWMQLYVHRDRGRTRELCARVAAAGVSAIVLTVDSPVVADNARNRRNGFNVPPGWSLPNLVPEGLDRTDLDIFSLVSDFDPTLSFDDIAEVSDWAGGLPVVVKGVLRGDDAARCVDAGAAAVSVSNHGGRQLDNVVATAHALTDVVEAVAGRTEVYVDGGIRRGVHVLMALALGARAVFSGRPIVWSLAVDGETGVRRCLDQLSHELEVAMALCGVTSVTDIPRDLVRSS